VEGGGKGGMEVEIEEEVAFNHAPSPIHVDLPPPFNTGLPIATHPPSPGTTRTGSPQ